MDRKFKKNFDGEKGNMEKGDESQENCKGRRGGLNS